MGWVLVPAVLAGVVAVAATVAIERLGGVRGGVLSTLPTTIVPASWGIGMGSSLEGFADAMYVVPAGMLLNAFVLLWWRLLPPRLPAGFSFGQRLAAVLVASLGFWLAAAFGTVRVLALLPSGPVRALVGALLTVGIVLAGVAACRSNPPAPRGTHRVSPSVLLARGLVATVAVGVAVGIARSGAGVAAGMASVFPAIFTTTMVSLWLSQGQAVPAGAVGPMMLGSASVGGYAVLLPTTWALWGPGPGMAAAWAGAVLGLSLPAFAWVRAPRA